MSLPPAPPPRRRRRLLEEEPVPAVAATGPVTPEGAAPEAPEPQTYTRDNPQVVYDGSVPPGTAHPPEAPGRASLTYPAPEHTAPGSVPDWAVDPTPGHDSGTGGEQTRPDGWDLAETDLSDPTVEADVDGDDWGQAGRVDDLEDGLDETARAAVMSTSVDTPAAVDPEPQEADEELDGAAVQAGGHPEAGQFLEPEPTAQTEGVAHNAPDDDSDDLDLDDNTPDDDSDGEDLDGEEGEVPWERDQGNYFDTVRSGQPSTPDATVTLTAEYEKRGRRERLKDMGRKKTGQGRIYASRGAAKNAAVKAGDPLTPRATRVLHQVAKYGYLTYDELAALNGWNKATGRGSLKAWQNLAREMVNDGLLTGFEIGPLRYVSGVNHVLRRDSVGLAGFFERPPAPGRFFHQAGVVRLGAMYDTGDQTAGSETYYMTEREIWALRHVDVSPMLVAAAATWADPTGTPSLQWRFLDYVVEGADGFKTDRHGNITGGYYLPDAVLHQAGSRPIGIEVETNQKRWPDYIDKLSALGSAKARARYGGFHYICPDIKARDTIRDAIRRVDADDFIQCTLPPSDALMPLPWLHMVRITGRKLRGTPYTDGTGTGEADIEQGTKETP